ncbi:MAG: phosphotransferase [Saccharofermentanales bacterium]|jgi:hypothetical protein
MDYETTAEKIKSDSNLLLKVCDYFEIDDPAITFCSDTSHGLSDIRINFYVNKDWIIKIHSKNDLNQAVFLELRKVIENYNKSGIYAPRYHPASDGYYLYEFCFEGREFLAWTEEYAPYESADFDNYSEEVKIDVLEKTAKYMRLNTNKDLMSRYSMWSIIELAAWDEEIDEKEENYRLLREALLSVNQSDLISQLDELNTCCRKRIKKAWPQLRKCSIQGDLNATNILLDHGKFAGLIDFNMAGTEVNINNILNETRYDLSMADFENLTAKEIYKKMTNYREHLLFHIFKFYEPDKHEKNAWDDYRKIVDLFLWPNVSLWNDLIRHNMCRDKVLDLITCIIES